jgi:site-specific DNA recombinase
MPGQEKGFVTALYGRTSKDDPRRVTIEIQQATLRDWSTRDSLVASVCGEYWDDGVTGKIPFRERPEGKRLFTDVAAGKIQSIAVAYSDRFGRTLLDGLQAVKEFEERGVKLVAVNDGWDARRNDSPLYFQFRMMMAEEEHRRIGQRMKDGKARAMDRDNAPPGGPLTFGYRMDEQGRFVPDPDEAPVVIRIFEMALKGKSNGEILEWVRKQGVRAGRKFQKRARGSEPVVVSTHQDAGWHLPKIGKILRNRTYAGIRTWSGREFPCSPLVDQESFDKLQVLLQEKAKKFGSGRFDPTKGLFSGVLTCGLCGTPYYYHARNCRRESGRVHRYFVYRCDRERRHNACRAKALRVDRIDGVMWGVVAEYLNDADSMVRKVLAADQSLMGETSQLDQEEARLTQELDDIEKKVRQIWDEQERNDWPVSWVQPKLNKLNKARQRATDALAETRKQRAKLLVGLAHSDEVKATIAAARAKFASLSQREKYDLIRLYVEWAVVETSFDGTRKLANISMKLQWGENTRISDETAASRSVPKDWSYGSSRDTVVSVVLSYETR